MARIFVIRHSSFVIHRRFAHVYHFRPFRNSDPQQLAEIWRDQPSQRGLMQPMTAGLLEQFVFAKPYFDPAGLIVATHDEVPIGFAHAGFGPNDEKTAVKKELGTTYLLMLRGDHRNTELADELLLFAESYLREQGSQVIYAGGIRPLDGFYLGLYGGSELPGVLASDPLLRDTSLRNGYCEIDRVEILQLDLSRFRPPFSRTQRQLRRETTFREVIAPPAASWWDACTTSAFDHLQYVLEPASGGAA